jgi:hypothetical protein
VGGEALCVKPELPELVQPVLDEGRLTNDEDALESAHSRPGCGRDRLPSALLVPKVTERLRCEPRDVLLLKRKEKRREAFDGVRCCADGMERWLAGRDLGKVECGREVFDLGGIDFAKRTRPESVTTSKER